MLFITNIKQLSIARPFLIEHKMYLFSSMTKIYLSRRRERHPTGTEIAMCLLSPKRKILNLAIFPLRQVSLVSQSWFNTCDGEGMHCSAITKIYLSLRKEILPTGTKMAMCLFSPKTKILNLAIFPLLGSIFGIRVLVNLPILKKRDTSHWDKNGNVFTQS